jgi:general secretion pathway protein K
MTPDPAPAVRNTDTRARRKRRADRRGVALVMVLAAITVLTVLLVEFQDESSANLSAGLTDRDALKAEYIARSGIALSRLLIAAEPTIRGAISPLLMMVGMKAPQIPVWEFSDRVLGAFNDVAGSKEFQALANVDLTKGKNLGLEGGRFELVIVDEDSKLNVNVAARGDAFSQTRVAMELLGLMAPDQYRLMFEQRDRDGQFSDRSTICSALVDWADPDENLYPCDPRATAAASSTGAEDAFYQMLDPPYRRKNAAFDSLDELHLVRGVGEDFWATFVDPEPGSPKKRIMTVWGQGAINVNTANAQTLLAVVCAGAPQAGICIDPMQMQMFVMAVGLIRGFTMGAPLFGSGRDFVKALQGQGMLGPMLTALGIQPVQFLSEAETAKMLTTESKVFSIYADGVVSGFRRETRVRIRTVVDFRSAPPPGMAPMYGMPGASGSAAGAMGMTPPATGALGGMPTSSTTQFGATPPGGASGAADAIQGALAPNPGGTIIYFKIE